jgi:hypothetical protein
MRMSDAQMQVVARRGPSGRLIIGGTLHHQVSPRPGGPRDRRAVGPQTPQYPARSTIPHDIARPPSRWHSDALVRPSRTGYEVARPSRLCGLGLARDCCKGYDLAGPCNCLVRSNYIMTPVEVPTLWGIVRLTIFEAFGRVKMIIYVTSYRIHSWVTLAATAAQKLAARGARRYLVESDLDAPAATLQQVSPPIDADAPLPDVCVALCGRRGGHARARRPNSGASDASAAARAQLPSGRPRPPSSSTSTSASPSSRRPSRRACCGRPPRTSLSAGRGARCSRRRTRPRSAARARASRGRAAERAVPRPLARSRELGHADGRGAGMRLAILVESPVRALDLARAKVRPQRPMRVRAELTHDEPRRVTLARCLAVVVERVHDERACARGLALHRPRLDQLPALGCVALLEVLRAVNEAPDRGACACRTSGWCAAAPGKL